jgi:hypothetical protein
MLLHENHRGTKNGNIQLLQLGNLLLMQLFIETMYDERIRNLKYLEISLFSGIIDPFLINFLLKICTYEHRDLNQEILK